MSKVKGIVVVSAFPMFAARKKRAVQSVDFTCAATLNEISAGMKLLREI
jgi:hypothetical protein